MAGAVRHLYAVQSPVVRSEIAATISQLTGQREYRFPGSLCRNLERPDLARLPGYVALPKTDGVRALFVIRGAYAVFVLRNMQMYTAPIPMHVSHMISLGTILDGEIVIRDDAQEILTRNKRKLVAGDDNQEGTSHGEISNSGTHNDDSAGGGARLRVQQNKKHIADDNATIGSNNAATTTTQSLVLGPKLETSMTEQAMLLPPLEVAENVPQIVFIVFDVLGIENRSTRQLPFNQRMRLAQSIVPCMVSSNTACLSVVCKEVYSLRDMIDKYAGTVDGLPCDGIVLCDPGAPYQSGRVMTAMFKWKPSDLVTVDLLLVRKPDAGWALYALCCNASVWQTQEACDENGGVSEYKSLKSMCEFIQDVLPADEPDLVVMLMAANLLRARGSGSVALELNTPHEEVVVECRHSNVAEVGAQPIILWHAFAPRLDKRFPNKSDVVASTRRSLEQNITLDDLRKYAA